MNGGGVATPPDAPGTARDRFLVKLGEYVSAIETALGVSAIKELLPRQAGDVPYTLVGVSELASQVGYQPATSVKVGMANFIFRYKDYLQT